MKSIDLDISTKIIRAEIAVNETNICCFFYQAVLTNTHTICLRDCHSINHWALVYFISRIYIDCLCSALQVMVIVT